MVVDAAAQGQSLGPDIRFDKIPNMDHISIVIVHFNTDRETKQCLQSLLKIKTVGFTYRVYVVDNGSKIPFKLKQEWEDKVQLIRSEANLGFSGGNNLALRAAIAEDNCDYAVLLNSDTMVSPDFLGELHQFCQKNPQVGMVSPLIYFGKDHEFHAASYQPNQRGKVVWFAGATIEWPNLLTFHRGVDEVDRGQFVDAQTTDFNTGCCVMVSRAVLEQVGLLNDDYFLYWEDVEWSVRTQRAGYQLAVCPSSVIWHLNAGSTGGVGSVIQVYYATRNRLLFALQYGTWRTKLTACSFAGRLLVTGKAIERRAVLDLIMGRLGKQPVLAS